jgi:hypothetical protein
VWPGNWGPVTVVERPEGLKGEIRRHAKFRLVLRDAVKLRRRKKIKGLVVASALLSRCRVRCSGWSGIQTGDGLSDPHDLERLNESPRLRACRFEGGHAHRVRPRRTPGTQTLEGQRAPAAASNPILSKSRLPRSAAMSSPRFFAAASISRKRVFETFSPNTLRYIRRLPLFSLGPADQRRCHPSWFNRLQRQDFIRLDFGILSYETGNT